MSEILEVINKSIDESINRLNSLKQLSENHNSIHLRKSLALLYNNRGFVYYRRVEFNLSADDYTSAIEYDPNLAIAYYNRATIHYRMNRFDKAFEDMKIAIDLEPNNPEFRLAFDQSYQQMIGNKIKTQVLN